MKQIYGMAALLAVMAAGCSQKPKTTVEEDQQRVLQIDSVDTHSGVQRMKRDANRDGLQVGAVAPCMPSSYASPTTTPRR